MGMAEQRTMTVKGQVTIPKDVRDALGLRPGEPVAFERDGDRVYLRRGQRTDEGDLDARVAAFRERLAKARAAARPLPLGMTTDEYMAMIRETVPIPNER